MDKNRRKYLRTATKTIVEMTHPSFGTINVKAGDLSDGGISVEMGSHIPPPLGTVVSVILKRHTGAINIEPVDMKVVHISGKGRAGLMFV